MASIGIKFPFSETNTGGVFKTTSTSQDSVKSNLISLLTTKRGQRVMNHSFFSPLFDFIMEVWDEIAEENLREALIEKIDKFFHEIEIKKIVFVFTEETHVLETKIFYSIIELGGVSDSVSISVNLEI